MKVIDSLTWRLGDLATQKKHHLIYIFILFFYYICHRYSIDELEIFENSFIPRISAFNQIYYLLFIKLFYYEKTITIRDVVPIRFNNIAQRTKC